jgi:outer membrane protein, heavy metal efflux system
VAQTLPYPGKKALDREMGRAAVKVSAAELALRRAELIRDVKAGFYRVLAAERLVDVSTQLAAAAESSASTAKKRVDAGATAYQEQLRAEVQSEQARTELTGFQRELAAAREILAARMGRPELRDVPLAGALAETPDTNLVAVVDQPGLTNHPSVAVAQAQLDHARFENRRARLEPYPDVKVALSGGRLGESDQSIVQMGFSLPLPLLDRGKGRQQSAQANVRAAEAELRAVQQQLEREWANARQRYRAAAEQVARYRERILPKADEALRLVRLGFEQGKFNFTDLVDTQRTTAEARLAYQVKLLDLNIAQAELEALLPPPTSTLSIPK